MNTKQSRLSLLALVAGFGVAAPATAQTPPFGSPPPGTYPILFNDHHVYVKPDELKRGRVLAALVRGSTILVPLRSMFEQMGASVSYDASSRTADISKPGADIKITVGKSEVVVNGESRPLDVPPEIDGGTVMVPIRVITEGMGAYVQWVADRQIVAIRYAPPALQPPPPPITPPPLPMTQAPTVVASPAVSPPPAPLPTPAPATTHGAEYFIVGDYIVSPTIYNEFSPGNRGGASLAGRAAAEVPFGKLAGMAEVTYTTWQYPTTSGPVTVIGGNGSTFVPGFNAHDTTADGRVGIGLRYPRIFLAASYLERLNNYGYPNQQGYGFGIEKLPDFDHRLWSIFGSFYYYPRVAGGTALAYRMYTYQAGIELHFNQKMPLFVEAGYMGDHGESSLFAPGSFSHQGGFVGIGAHF